MTTATPKTTATPNHGHTEDRKGPRRQPSVPRPAPIPSSPTCARCTRRGAPPTRLAPGAAGRAGTATGGRKNRRSPKRWPPTSAATPTTPGSAGDRRHQGRDRRRTQEPQALGASAASVAAADPAARFRAGRVRTAGRSPDHRSVELSVFLTCRRSSRPSPPATPW